MTQHIFKLDSSDGLPNMQIHNFVFDKFKRLWAAGPAGLICYTGDFITVYNTQHGLQCSGLRTVAIQYEKFIWIGTDRGIECLLLDGTIRDIVLDFEWTYGVAECFFFEDESIWIGTSHGILHLKEIKGKLHLIHEEATGLVQQIHTIHKNLYFVTSKNGVLNFINNSFEKVLSQLDENLIVGCIHFTLDQQLLVGTSNGLYIIGFNGKIMHHHKNKDAANNVKAICTIQNQWVVAYSDRVSILNETSFAIEIAETIPIDGFITSIEKDEFNNIWVGTNNDGLKKINVLRKMIKQHDTGSPNAVFSVTPFEDNLSFSIGGEGFYSVITFDDRYNKTQLKEIHQIDTIVWDSLVVEDQQGLTYLATQHGLYKKKKGEAPVLEHKLSKKIGAPCRVLKQKQNTIYLGTISGLYSFDDDGVTEIKKANGQKFGYVYNINEDNQGLLWIATLGQGLWKEETHGFVQVENGLLAEKGSTYATIHNKRSSIVSQQENLVLLEEDTFDRIIDSSFPIGGWSLGWVDEQTVAVGTDMGIKILELKNPRKTIINLFLPISKWQATSSRAMYTLKNGQLLYGQISGLYTIDFEKIKSIIQAPIIKVDSIKWTNANPTLFGDTYDIAFGKWIFEAKVYTAWHLDSLQVQYRYKLVGFDEEWTKLDSDFKINYNSLPPGKYELFAQAYTTLTGYGEALGLIKLNVTPSNENSLIPDQNSISNASMSKEEFLSRNEILLSQNKSFIEEIEQRKLLEKELKIYKLDLEELIKKRTKELVEEKERAEETNKLKTLFLASMSHEIRTPLSGILGLTELIKNSELNPIQRDYVKKLDKSSKHLLEIVNDVLDISKIEAGKTTLEIAPFSLYELLDEVADYAQLRNNHKRLNIIFDVNIQPTHLIRSDKTKVKQVLINLLSNAIKFTETGNIILRITEVQQKQEFIILAFSVEDSGVGIDVKETPLLINAFQKADNQQFTKIDGSGLGLNISNNIIEMMEGKLEIDSTPGVGSIFSFTLKLNKDENRDTLLDSYKDIMLIGNEKTGVYLHDKIESEVLKNTLQNLGFSHIKVFNSHKGIIKAIKSSEIELCIIDDSTTEFGELEAYQNQAQIHKQTQMKSIFISPTNNYQVIDQVQKIGFDEVLLKPFTKKSISKTLSALFTENQSDLETTLIKSKDRHLAQHSFKGKHILVAEDDTINQLVITRFLEELKCKITLVRDGISCIEALKNDLTIDLVLMDIQMPKLNGIDATRIIRTELNNTGIPIIAFTADVNAQLIKNTERLGLNGFISKPIDKQHLENTLSLWLFDEKHII